MREEPIRKKTGLAHLFAAAAYSAGGARRLLGEAAFRHELLAFAAVMAGFLLVGADFSHFGTMAILFLVLLAFEAVNTAIEEIVDRVSPEISDMARHAKDLGSFACFCLILANSGYAAYVLLSRFI